MAGGIWQVHNDNGVAAANTFHPTVTGEAARIKEGAWNTLEIKLFQSATAGILTVKVNGVVCMNAVDIGNVGLATAWDTVAFWGVAGDGNHIGVRYGDIIISDDTGATFNDFIGDFRFETAVPDADGATVDWTRNTGASDYLAIDEAVGAYDDDTTYIESSAIDEDAYATYPAASLSGVDTIHFVALCSRAKDDAGSAPLSVAHIVENNASVDVATTKAVAATYEFVVDIFETNPDGSIAWTKTSIDAAEYGIRSKT
jgi:hypothetical protein